MGWFDTELKCKKCSSKYKNENSTADDTESFCSKECEKSNNMCNCECCEKEYLEENSTADDTESFCSKKCENEDNDNISYNFEITLNGSENINLSEIKYSRVKELKEKILESYKNNEKYFILKEEDENYIIFLDKIHYIKFYEV